MSSSVVNKPSSIIKYIEDKEYVVKECNGMLHITNNLTKYDYGMWSSWDYFVLCRPPKRAEHKRIDSQRQAVYNWEDKFRKSIDNRTLDLDQCRYYVDWCYSLYGYKSPSKIKDGRGYKCAMGGINVIVLPKWARNEIVVIHEACHGIHKYMWSKKKGVYNIDEGAGHGKVFMRIFIDCLCKVKGVKQEFILNHIEKFNNSPERFRKRKIRVAKESEVVRPGERVEV